LHFIQVQGGRRTSLEGRLKSNRRSTRLKGHDSADRGEDPRPKNGGIVKNAQLQRQRKKNEKKVGILEREESKEDSWEPRKTREQRPPWGQKKKEARG